MSAAADRAKSLHAQAEAAREAGDLKTASCLKSAAGAWERIAGPGVAWSTKDLHRDLRLLRIDVAISTGPFQPPVPPKAPAPAQERSHHPALNPPPHVREALQVLEAQTIQF